MPAVQDPRVGRAVRWAAREGRWRCSSRREGHRWCIASRLLADPRTPARLERHSPRSELVANTTREPYFAMTRNTEGSHGTHATLAHVTRPEILTYLMDKGYICVGQIAENLGIPDSTLSGHLTVTKIAGLLVSRQPVHRRGPHRVLTSAVDGQESVDRVPVFQAFTSKTWCVMVTRLHSREPRDHHCSSRPCRGDVPAPRWRRGTSGRGNHRSTTSDR